jgi:hypothetical protein
VGGVFTAHMKQSNATILNAPLSIGFLPALWHDRI